MKKEEENIHCGHRARLLDTVLKAGIENVSDVQALEFILTYVFPRGDVNPLAHRLLKEFGSVSNILEAEVNSLKSVQGMGESSAKRLHMLGEVFFFYTQNKLSTKICLGTYSDMTDYFDELLRFSPVENFVILALDASYNLKAKKILAIGNVKNVGLDPMKVADFILSTKPVHIVFAHNHPGGSAKASTQDEVANDKMKDLVIKLGVNFIDHILVGEDGIYSLKQKDFLRKFN